VSARRKSATSSSSAPRSPGCWGSAAYQGNKTDPLDEPGAKGATPLKIALDTSNIHHYLVGAQGALPVDAAGNPWSGSYVYNSGNLVLDLLYNLMLEATGRLQKCRIYESRSFWTKACIASSTASVPMIKARPTSCSAEPHPQMTAPS
jgi:hypothetical protein